MSKLKVSESVAPSITPSAQPEVLNKTPKQEANDMLYKFMVDESKLVKGRFKNYKNPGGTEKICYKKYPTPDEMRKRGQPGGVHPFSMSMTDGETYEIPLYVARHLNGIDVTARDLNGKLGSCSYAVHGFKMSHPGDLRPSTLGQGPGNEMGIPVPIVGVAKRVQRFGFESLEFIGD